MPTATIPIVLNISVVLPEGVSLAPQVGENPHVWQYTAAPAGGDESGNRRASDDQTAALRKADLEQLLADLVAELPKCAGFNDQDLANLSKLLRDELRKDLDRHATAPDEAILARLQAANARQAEEIAQLHAELAKALCEVALLQGGGQRSEIGGQ